MSTDPENKKEIHVSAGILQRDDGRFLLAQRPAGKIWEGYWEFPGGKIEPGEQPLQALLRELHEELGIQVKQAYPWLHTCFDYPHARVHLHFFRINRWEGELQSRENQQLSWEPEVSPILPANESVLRALQLPSLYAISNIKELGETSFLHCLEQKLAQGLRLVQLREKGYSQQQVRQMAQRILPLIRDYQASLILNADIELALALNADGVQLSSQQLNQLTEKPPLRLCAASCHNQQELDQAVALGCDFALLSPVLPTQSHPGAATLGWDHFADLTANSPIPVYALGGLSNQDMETAWRHGAHGIALLRGAWR